MRLPNAHCYPDLSNVNFSNSVKCEKMPVLTMAVCFLGSHLTSAWQGNITANDNEITFLKIDAVFTVKFVTYFIKIVMWQYFVKYYDVTVFGLLGRKIISSMKNLAQRLHFLSRYNYLLMTKTLSSCGKWQRINALLIWWNNLPPPFVAVLYVVTAYKYPWLQRTGVSSWDLRD